MMRPLFGDFLAAASEHIDTAAGYGPDLPAEAAPAVVGELARVTGAMVRCADAFALPTRPGPSDVPDARELAVLDARSALRRTTALLRAAARALGGGDAGCPVADCLSAAADSLAAGHDLLQGHFVPVQHGWRQGDSLWAPAIASGPVSTALVTEMGQYAARLAPWVLALAAARTSDALPARARAAIGAACRWLWVAQAASWAADYRPGSAAEHALLHAIPANLAPPRCPPRGGEPVPGLCSGAAATAERLGYLAHRTATRGHPQRAALAASWQRTAQGAAITGHCAELILRQFVGTTAEVLILPGAVPALRQAAEAANTAWAAWRTAAHSWDILTTGPGTTLTPVATNIGDLVLWLGRLAHTSPAWTPARNQASPIRTSDALACDSHTITGVIAALHHASDALARIAACDRENVRSAAAAGNLYIPTRLLPADYDIPRRYTPILPAMTDTLLATYDATAEAAAHAAAALDRVALGLNPQPTVLTTLRAVAPLSDTRLPSTLVNPAPQPATQPPPGQVEQALRSHGITEPALLARAADIDNDTMDLINTATDISQRRAVASRKTPQASPAQRQHPARLAAKDSHAVTASTTPLPQLIPIGHQLRHRTPAQRGVPLKAWTLRLGLILLVCPLR